MRAGSFLLWNQLVVHGSCSNKSSNFRMAQFITGFRAGAVPGGTESDSHGVEMSPNCC